MFCEDAKMTPEQIELVQSSFAKVAPISDDAARNFYGRLFNIAPEVKSLFTGDMDEQGRKLMQMLTVVVNGLKDLDTVIPAAEKLAIRHVDYGVHPEHYQPVGEALIWTLKEGLGPDFNDDVEAAWLAAYSVLSSTMINAAYGPH
jgi:nitric oxide dioxygenase